MASHLLVYKLLELKGVVLCIDTKVNTSSSMIIMSMVDEDDSIIKENNI